MLKIMLQQMIKRFFSRTIAPILERSWLQGSVWTWVLAPLLWPISKLVWFTWRLSRASQKRTLPKKLAVPLLVVGNVYVGGVGKTPLVIALVEHLQHLGLAVGVISRGYTPHDPKEVPSAQAIRPKLIDDQDKAFEVGDEPMLIFKRTRAPVCIATNRFLAAQHLLEQRPELQLIISDDGLQSSHLSPDMTLCVFDDRGLGNGMTLPAGPLREPWPRVKGLHPSQLAPYQWVMNTGANPKIQGFNAQRRLAPVLCNALGERVTLQSLQAPSPQSIWALAGVARPDMFFKMLQEAGLPIQKTIALPDHAGMEDYLQALAFDALVVRDDTKDKPMNPEGIDRLVLCTEKDAVKLWTLMPQAYAVGLELELPEAFLRALEDALKALMGTPLGFSNAQNEDIILR